VDCVAVVVVLVDETEEILITTSNARTAPFNVHGETAIRIAVMISAVRVK
jgi:hypothetical protein